MPKIRNPRARHSVGTGKMVFKPAHVWSQLAVGFWGLARVEQPRLRVEVFKESADTCRLEAWNWTGSPTWSREAERQSEQHHIRGRRRSDAHKGFYEGVSRGVGANWERHTQASRNQSKYFMDLKGPSRIIDDTYRASFRPIPPVC